MRMSQPRGGLGECGPGCDHKGHISGYIGSWGKTREAAAAAATPAATDFRPGSPGLKGRRGPPWCPPLLCRAPPGGEAGWSAPGGPSWTSTGLSRSLPALFLPGAAAEHRADLPLK